MQEYRPKVLKERAKTNPKLRRRLELKAKMGAATVAEKKSHREMAKSFQAKQKGKKGIKAGASSMALKAKRAGMPFVGTSAAQAKRRKKAR